MYGWAAISAAPAARARSRATSIAQVDADEALEADGDRVCRQSRVDVVVGELEPGQKEQVVLGPGALGLAADRVEVRSVVPRVDVAGP